MLYENVIWLKTHRSKNKFVLQFKSLVVSSKEIWIFIALKLFCCAHLWRKQGRHNTKISGCVFKNLKSILMIKFIPVIIHQITFIP